MEQANNILVSIIIPCYNQAEYLPDALNSCIDQTYPHWEAIVVDDGSPDNTKEIVTEYMKKDNRIRIVSVPNGGLSYARNNGIRVAHGKYVLPLDADDKIAPTYIEKALQVFHSQETTLVYCQWQFFGAKTDTPPLAYLGYKSELINNSIFCSSVFERKKALEIGGYDENMRHGHEDWEFYIRLLDGNAIVNQIKEPLFFYRMKNTVSLIEIAHQRAFEVLTYIYDKHRDKYLEYFGDPISNYRRMEKYAAAMAFDEQKGKMKRAKNKTEAKNILKQFTANYPQNSFCFKMKIKYLCYWLFRH